MRLPPKKEKGGRREGNEETATNWHHVGKGHR